MLGRAQLPAVRRAVAQRTATLRRLRDQYDNKEVRHARALIRALRSGPPDLVIFGDSTWLFRAPYDRDQRSLAEMVIAELDPSLSVHVCIGAGYHAKPITAYLRLIQRSGTRPAVVLPLCVRMHTVAWSTHPAYEYQVASRRIDALPADVRWPKVRASIPLPTPDDFEAYGRQRISTLAGDRTIAELREPLRDPAAHGLSAKDQQSLLYAYHHGELLDPAHGNVQEVAEMGAVLRSLATPVVALHTPVPVEQGVALWGEQFRERQERNFHVLDDTFRRGYDAPIQIQPTGLAHPDSEFIDPADGTEHLNAVGRRRMAETLASAITEALPRRSRV